MPSRNLYAVYVVITRGFDYYGPGPNSHKTDAVTTSFESTQFQIAHRHQT